MRRLPRWLLAVLSLSIVAAAIAIVAIAWNQRADDLCADAPQAVRGYSVKWGWSEFAYMCDYELPNAQTIRVGVVDAFHGEGRRRHLGDR